MNFRYVALNKLAPVIFCGTLRPIMCSSVGATSPSFPPEVNFPCRSFCNKNERHRIGRVRRDGIAGIVDLFFGVAVIGRDRE